jgi:hypothetical protein
MPNGFISVDLLKGVAGVARTCLSRGKKENFLGRKIEGDDSRTGVKKTSFWQ